MEASQIFTSESLPSNDTSLIDRFPYAFMLVSNDIPSDDEVEEIKEFLLEPTAKIQEMDTEVASLLAKVDIIRHEQAALKKQVEACRSLITISRRLPDDILLEVFFRCLPEKGFPTLDSTTAPLLLTAVCRRWRILALRTTKLWSTIHLSIQEMYSWTTRGRSERSPRATQSSLYRMLQMWLERSGTCPLTFSLSIPGVSVFNPEEERDAMVAGFSNKLLPFASRLMNVSLSLSGDTDSLPPLFNIPASEFRLLESLFLQVGDSDISAAVSMFDAPNLRKISIRHTNLNPSSFPLPWVRLTHLDLCSAGLDDDDVVTPNPFALSGVLNQCTSLIYLGLDIDGQHRDNVTSIYLPRLQRIFIRKAYVPQHSDPRAYRVFFENFQAPSLRQIGMQGFMRKDFASVLSRHGQHVQRLELHADRLTDMDSFALSLQHCPSLRFLLITSKRYGFGSRGSKNIVIDKTFFSFLTGNTNTNTNEESENDTGPRCPLLEELILDNIDCKSLASLVSFLKAKQYGDPRVFAPLIRFSTNGSIQENGRKLWREMIDRGLKPFTDRGLVVEIWEGQRPCSYESLNDHHHYADCWKDR